MRTAVTIDLDEVVLATLDRVAKEFGRSRTRLVEDAVTAHLEEAVAFLAFLQEGEDAIDRGEFYTKEQMEEWFQARRHVAAAE